MTNNMKTTCIPLRRPMTLSLLSGLAVAVLNLLLAPTLPAADSPKDPAAPAGDMVPLAIKLPAPAFKGTPKDLQLGPNVEPISDKPRAPMMVPIGMKNIALDPKVKITCSDKNVPADNLAKLVDRPQCGANPKQAARANDGAHRHEEHRAGPQGKDHLQRQERARRQSGQTRRSAPMWSQSKTGRARK